MEKQAISAKPKGRDAAPVRRAVRVARGKRGAARWVRLVVQLVFLLSAPATFSMAFAGARYVFVQLGAGEPVGLTSFVVLLVGLCAYTIVFGRFFCGWVCGFGTLGDMLYQAGDFVVRKLGIKRRSGATQTSRKLRYIKHAVLVVMLVGSFFGASSAIAAVSPWTAFGRLTNLQVMEMNVIGAVLLVLIAVGMVARERFFCRYLCPLGALFSILPRIPWHKRLLKLGGCGVRPRLARSLALAAVLFAFFVVVGAVNIAFVGGL